MFKKSLAVKSVLSVVLATSLSQGMAADFVIKKSNGTGFVHPDYARNEICEVGMNATEVTVTYGIFPENSVKTTRIVVETLSNDIQGVLKKSFESEVKHSPNLLCDAPGTSITANYNGEEFVLFASGGCGSDRLERDDASSQMLKDIVNRHCPTTHDFR